MSDRIERELTLLRRHYPELESWDEGQWVLIPRYSMPAGIWDHDEGAVAFQIPLGYPGNQPYGFYVRPRVRLKNGSSPNTCTNSAGPPFGGDWLKFSRALS